MKESKIPTHVGVILDGNRRFAKKLLIKPWKGHEWGAKKVESLLDWSKEVGIKEITFYAFSIENFDRPKEEFDYLMKLFTKEFVRLKEDKKLKEEGIRINFIGRINLFPEELQKIMHELQEKTKNNSEKIVNFAMAYSGRAEIIDATKKISEKIKSGELKIEEINEEIFSKSLYLESEPDLIIRTSGEKRTSGFMLWQGSYAEWHFTDKCWPEFEKEDFMKAIKDFSLRERRFGR